jgi:hypothetical protein
VEGGGQEAAVVATGVPAFLVVGTGGRAFWIVYLFDARMGGQDVADSFCVDADALDAGDEVAAVAFEEDAVFGPVVVDVVLIPDLLQDRVVSCSRVEDESGAVLVYVLKGDTELCYLPSAHNVAISAKDLR